MSVAGSKVSDLFGSDVVLTADATVMDGITHDDAFYMGIEGAVFCGSSDCKVTDDAGTLVLTGSWYFLPDSTTELHVSAMGGLYEVATMYARYGYWLTYDAEDDAAGVTTYAVKGHESTNTADLDLLRGDATTDVTATYTGDAVGIAVRDKTSGQFTAAVTLTATFGATDSKLGGTISGFDIAGTDPGWTVMLEKTLLTNTAVLSGVDAANIGVAYGDHAAAGRWTAQGYGPDGDPAVASRPEGFFGQFNANFSDGAAAGAYATRK